VASNSVSGDVTVVRRAGSSGADAAPSAAAPAAAGAEPPAGAFTEGTTEGQW